MLTLTEEIALLLDAHLGSPEVEARFRERLGRGNLTRDEDSASHFCCYFLPYDQETKRVFIGHHKKADLWLPPGGHIDPGETLLQTVNREIGEELGVAYEMPAGTLPFLLTITQIENPRQTCKEHLEIWYHFLTDGKDFRVDEREFHETRWVSIAEALALITDGVSREAITKTERMFP